MNHWVCILSVAFLIAAPTACSSSSSSSDTVATQTDLAMELALQEIGESDIAPSDLGSETVTPDMTVAGPTYSADIRPLLQGYCAPCHTTNGSGSTNFASIYSDAFEDSKLCPGVNVGACGLTLVLSGEMPVGKQCSGDPETDADKPGCLTQNAIDLYQAWLEAGLPE
jgi:hypothetical protein